MAKKIERLFKRRQSTFDKYSQAILDAITPNMISAITEVLGFTDEELTRLEWNNVRLVDGHILVSGAIMYRAGEDIIADDGEEVITLDDTTALILNKLVRIALPIQLVETYSREEIVAHLKEMEKKYKKEYQDVYGSDPTVHQLDISDYEGDTMEEKLASAVRSTMQNPKLPEVEEFKYGELTDEQKESLRLSSLIQQTPKGSKSN